MWLQKLGPHAENGNERTAALEIYRGSRPRGPEPTEPLPKPGHYSLLSDGPIILMCQQLCPGLYL